MFRHNYWPASLPSSRPKAIPIFWHAFALTLRGFDTYFWHHTQKPDWVIHRPEPKPP
jgi:hypothetical protein